MDATNNIATDLFYKIRSRFRGLKLGGEDGAITIQPQEARFFDFDYMEGEEPIGHVSISLAEPNSMKVYFSTGITESMDHTQKTNWYTFLKELRQFAKRRLMSFDTRDIAKDNLDQRDYAFLSQTSQSNTMNTSKPVGESVMSESTMYGTKNVSYQKLMDSRLIIKHSHALTDDAAPGARSRNISALFVENQDGERFKYPFIHLAGARAMQRHVANGGLPYDDLGKSIIGMSEQIAQLRSFNNYVVRNDLMNSNTNGIVERSSQALTQMREQLKALSKQGHYEAYKESFQAQQPMEVPQDVVEDFTEKFTVRNFKEDIASVFPVLYRLMQENSDIGYDDIVAMTADEQVDETIDDVKYDPFAQFEDWAMKLGEESAIVSQDNGEQAQAVKELQELVGQHFPAGVDGTNAIESLKGIIEDPELFQAIKQQAKEDADSCVRPLVKDWLEQNAPTVIDELDFGDLVDDEVMKDPRAQQDDGEGLPYDFEKEDADSDKEKNNKDDQYMQRDMNQRKRDMARSANRRKIWEPESKSKLDVQELAEYIHTFYDRDSATFPKGPEGVATMVGKKYGEQAESVARKMVERMAPQQTSDTVNELSRIKQLSGMSEAGAVFAKGDKVVVSGKQNATVVGQDGDTYYVQVDGQPGSMAVPVSQLAAPKTAEQQFNRGDVVMYKGQKVTYIRPYGDGRESYITSSGGSDELVATSDLTKEAVETLEQSDDVARLRALSGM